MLVNSDFNLQLLNIVVFSYNCTNVSCNMYTNTNIQEAQKFKKCCIVNLYRILC